MDTYWTGSVYDPTKATLCVNAGEFCEATLTGSDLTYACVTAATASGGCVDYDAMVATEAVALADGGTLCYVSPASSTLVTDTTDTTTEATTGDEAAGETCTAWITETPETGCGDDDVPADDAPDADFDKYIRDCKVDYTKGECGDGTSCAMVFSAADGSVSQSCQKCEASYGLADMKDPEGAGATSYDA